MEGRFADVSVVAALRLVLMRPRRALVVARVDKLEGELIVEGGRIVDARLAEESGRKVALEMLRWRGAVVEVRDGISMSSPSMNASLDELLKEGLVSTVPTELPLPNKASDSMLEDGLMAMFSALERDVAALERQRREGERLAYLEGVVRRMVAACRRWTALGDEDLDRLLSDHNQRPTSVVRLRRSREDVVFETISDTSALPIGVSLKPFLRDLALRLEEGLASEKRRAVWHEVFDAFISDFEASLSQNS